MSKTGKEEETISPEEFSPPSVNFVWKLTQPMRDYFTPEFIHLDRIEAGRPALYIANHTIYGITDWVLLMAEIYKIKSIFFRTLSDKMHYSVPVWKQLVEYFGMIIGSRENCSALMKAGKHIMVFPGGGREVFRHKNEKYTLQWKQRTGFAHMAIQHGYDIVPIAQVGGDDAYDVIADADDIMKSFIGSFIKASGIYTKLKDAEYLPPISRGLLGTAFPKPVKLYFSVGRRITTNQYNGKITEKNLWQVRQEAEYELSKEIIALLEHRKTDDIGWLRKMLVKL